MKKLILTSPAFEGEIQIIYNTEFKLMLIDMMQTNLTDEQIRYLKNVTPVEYRKETFKPAFKSETLEIIEADYKVTFEMFWEKYGLKRNKERCIKQFEKLSESNKTKAFAGLNPYIRHLAHNTWKSKADPEKYLSQKYWLNDWK